MAVPTNTIDTQPISLTEGAIQALNKIRQDEAIPDDHFLRVGVKGGGCSGFTYVLGFDVKKDNDEVFEVGGLPIVMQRAHQLYLMGIEIDWSNGLNNRGFVFNNPNATDTCGCGTSFNA
ncbi:MAG: iron-sulfur cluster assembly accessory protein [Saprospiraceae bacterium]|nr:iron-sulfur cluster assembly accessory protein [Saprospiraceae bacterium]